MKQELVNKVINGMSETQKEDGNLALEILNVNEEAFDKLLDSSNLKNSKDFADKAMHAGVDVAYKVYDRLGENVKTDKDFIISTLKALNEEKETIHYEPKEENVVAASPVEKEEVTEETYNLPGLDEVTQSEEVKENSEFNFKSNLYEFNKPEVETPVVEETVAPQLDENGFDISHKENNIDEKVESLANLNEMYNNPEPEMDPNQMILR